MEDILTISELIGMVHDELIKSQKEREANGKAPLFQVDELELELNTEVTLGVGGKMVLGIPTLKMSVSGDDNEKNIQKIKLKFKVVEDDGDIVFHPGYNSRMDGRLPKMDE